jgi:hypothetical protein
MNMTNAETKNLPPTTLWPLGITLALLSMITICFITAYLAFNNRSIMVEDRPYEKGLKFDETHKARSLGQKLNFINSLKFLTDATSGLTKIELILNNNELVSDINITLRRSETNYHDQTVALSRDKNSPTNFTSEFIKLPLGYWNLIIDIYSKEGKAQYLKRELLKQGTHF